MTRKDPTLPVPGTDPVPRDDVIVQTRIYRIITPLYGGGEMPARPDSLTTVRGTEVRGHLRFWWRATRGGAFDGSLEKMRDREEEIWGSAGAAGKPGPSPVIISVRPIQRGQKFQATDRKGRNIDNIGHPASVDGYVAFPLRAENKPSVMENVEFELKIEYPEFIHGTIDMKKEVEAALWAWETFGGIGARTRRGFGALQLQRVVTNGRQVAISPCHSKDLSNLIDGGLQTHLPPNPAWPRGVPHLNPNLRFKWIRDGDPIKAWRRLFNSLRDFRQARYTGRGGSRFGRSKWPEPDVIRHMPGMTSSPRHRKPLSRVNKFPRAKFGLPIIFQFKSDDVDEGDPEPTTLQGLDEYDRLASPLILRPLACADGAVGLAAILEWEPLNPEDERYTPPGGLVLKTEQGDQPVRSDLTQSEATNIRPLSGNPDIFEAFLNFLK